MIKHRDATCDRPREETSEPASQPFWSDYLFFSLTTSFLFSRQDGVFGPHSVVVGEIATADDVPPSTSSINGPRFLQVRFDLEIYLLEHEARLKIDIMIIAHFPIYLNVRVFIIP